YKGYVRLFPQKEHAAISALRIGQSFFLTERYDEALRYFTDVKEDKLDTNFRQILYFYTGKSYRAKANKDKALDYYKKAQGLSEGGRYKVYALLEIADIFIEASDYKKAIEYYDKAYSASETDELKAFTLYEKGKAYFSSGDYLNSAETFKRVFKEYPGQDISKDAMANLLLSFFNMSKYEDLIIEYQNSQGLIGGDEGFFNTHYIAASAYSELKDYGKSLLVLDKILSFKALGKEDRHKTLLKKTEVLIKSKEFKQAGELIEKELKDAQIDNDRIIFMKAESYYGLSDFDKSYELYKNVAEEFKDSPFADSALYGMAYAKKSQGKIQEALDVFIRYFKEGEDDARRQDALYNTILIEIKSGHTEKAIEHSRLYLSTFEEASLNEKILFRLGSLYSEAKEYDKAADVFKQFIDRFEKSENLAEAYFLLAYNLQSAEEFDEALKYYEKVPLSKENKLFYSSLKNRAFIYLNRKEDNNAAGIFNRIITDFKENDLGIEAYLWLAKHYLSSKNYSEPLRILKNVESREGASGRVNEISYFRAEAHREMRNFEEAVKDYNAVLSAEGEDTGATGASHIGKGLCLIEMKDFDKAKVEFETAVLNNPDDNTVTMRARFEMANIEKFKANLDEAAKLYMLVAVLYNDDYYSPEALFRAGEIFQALNREQEAIKVYEEIVKTYEKTHLCEKAKERIRALSES
ncbi:MAG: tetratricopeptide repeat protein, partial [Candidatus Omnitrophota bacterium]